MNRLTDSLRFNALNVDNILKQNLSQKFIGCKLFVLKTKPSSRQWSADINLVRQSDIASIKNIVAVNNYHRPDRVIDLSILEDIQIEYQEPQVVTDVKEEYDLEKLKWGDGASFPSYKYVMRKNPEFTTEEDAREYSRQEPCRFTGNI